MSLVCLYIVECSDGSYYTGVTNSIERRLQEHNIGIEPYSYTYSRRPVKLKFVSELCYPSEAIAAEKQIKRWGRKKKEALINGDFDLLVELSRCKNKSGHVNYKKI